MNTTEEVKSPDIQYLLPRDVVVPSLGKRAAVWRYLAGMLWKISEWYSIVAYWCYDKGSHKQRWEE